MTCAAFSPGAEAVREHFTHWERVSDGVTDEQVGNWSVFYREADGVFTEAAMDEGRALLAGAAGERAPRHCGEGTQGSARIRRAS